MRPLRCRLIALVLIGVLLAAGLPVPAGGDDPPLPGSGTQEDPWILEDAVLTAENRTVLSLRDMDGHVVLKNLTLAGRALIHLNNVTSVRIENVTGTATDLGIVARDVGTLEIVNVTLETEGTGIIVSGSTVHATKLLMSAGGDAIVANEAALVVTGSLLSASGGVIVTEGALGLESTGVSCQGAGVQVHQGTLNLHGNVIDCRDAGVIIRDGTATTSGNQILGPARGFVASDASLSSQSDQVVASKELAFTIHGGDATLVGPAVNTETGDGIDAWDVALTLTGADVEAPQGTAVRARSGSITESGGRFEAATGFDLRNVDAHLAQTTTTRVSVQESAVRAWGGTLESTARFVARGADDGVGLDVGAVSSAAFGHLEIDGFATGMRLDAGTDMEVDRLDVENVTDQVVHVDRQGRLVVKDTGTWAEQGPMGAGVLAERQSVVELNGIVVEDALSGPLVEITDGELTMKDVVMRGGEDGPSATPAAVVAEDSLVEIRGSQFTKPESGIMIKGHAPDPDPDATEPTAPFHLIQDTEIGAPFAHGIVLDNTTAHIDDVRIYDGTPDVADAAALRAVDESAFIVENSQLGGDETGHPDEDAGERFKYGIFWDGLDRLPRSTLFPESAPGVTDGRVLVRESTLAAGVGIHAEDVHKDVGFHLEDVTIRARERTGDLQNVAFEFTGGLVMGLDMDTMGFRSGWDPSPPGVMAQAMPPEHVLVQGVIFERAVDGLILVGHGDGVRVLQNEFHDHDALHFHTCDLYCDLGQTDDLVQKGTGVHIREGSGTEGPLVQKNLFRNHHWYGVVVDAQTGARIVDNDFDYEDLHRDDTPRSGLVEHTAGIGLRDSTGVEIVRNRIMVEEEGIAILTSSAEVRENRIDAAENVFFHTDAGIRVTGSGTETVTILENFIVNMKSPAPGIANARGGVTWRDAHGTIESNWFGPLEGGDPRHAVDTGVQVFEVVGGGPTPTIVKNVFLTRERGIITNPELYEGANRIHGNSFRTGQGMVHAITSTARDHHAEDHGPYTDSHGSPGTHAPSLGANVANNHFENPYVHCHFWTHPDDPPPMVRLDPEFDCTDEAKEGPQPGQTQIASHNFLPFLASGGGAGPSGTLTPIPLPEEEPLPGRAMSTRTKIMERCRGIVLEPVTLQLEDLGEGNVRLTGTDSFRTEGLHPDAELCDDEGAIVREFVVNGEVVATGVKQFLLDGEVNALYEVTYQTRIDSIVFGFQQQLEDGRIWTGTEPVIHNITSDLGFIFVKAVPTPGGVTLTANVEWPGGYGGGHVVWKYAGQERRAYGERPTLTLDPGLAWALQLIGPTTVDAMAFDPRSELWSEPTDPFRFKLVPYPFFLSFLPGSSVGVKITTPAALFEEMKLKGIPITLAAGDDPVIEWKWSYELLPSTELKKITRLPVLRGLYSFKVGVDMELKVASTGAGAGSVEGKLEKTVDTVALHGEAAAGLKATVKAELDDIHISEVEIELKLGGLIAGYFPLADVLNVVPGGTLLLRIPYLGKALRGLQVGLGYVPQFEMKGTMKPVEGKSCGLEDWDCKLGIEASPGLRGILRYRWDSMRSIHLNATGILHVAVTIPGDPGNAIKLEGIDFSAVFTGEAKWGKRLFSVQHTLSTKTSSPTQGFVIPNEVDWHIPERSWDTPGVLTGQDGLLLSGLPDATDVSFSPGVLAWTRDDLDQEWPRSMRVALAVEDGGTWTDLGNLTAGGFDDGGLGVARLDEGVLVAWVRDMNESLAVGPSDPIVNTTEVMAAFLDTAALAGGALPAPVRLTDNDVLDDGVHVVPGPQGDAVIVWRSNAANAPMGNETDPDEVWAVRVSSTGTFQAPVLAWSGLFDDLRRFAWDGDRLWMASVEEDGTVRVSSSDLEGGSTATDVGTSDGAMAILAMRVEGAALFVAWLQNETDGNGTRIAEVRLPLDDPGSSTAPLMVGEPRHAVQLQYATGDPRTLLFTAPGENVTLSRHMHNGTAYEAAEVIHTSEWDFDVLHAAAGDPLGVVLREYPMESTSTTFEYEGPNMDSDEGEPVSLSVEIPVPTRMPGDVRSLDLKPHEPPAADEPTTAVQVLFLDARPTSGDEVHARAVVVNEGDASTPAIMTRFILDPFTGPTAATADVAIPELAPGGAALVEAAIPVGDVTGRQFVHLEGLSGALDAVVHLQPRWELVEASRGSPTIQFTLANTGVRTGTTTAAAYALSADQEAITRLASVDLTVDAGDETTGALALPETFGDLPVILVVEPEEPGHEVDQGVLGARTSILLEGAVPLEEYAGVHAFLDGTKHVAFDLKNRTGVGDIVLDATLDAVPVTLQLDDGRLVGTLDLVVGLHRLEVRIEDLALNERRLVFTLLVEDSHATSITEINMEGTGDGRMLAARLGRPAGDPVADGTLEFTVRQSDPPVLQDTAITDDTGRARVDASVLAPDTSYQVEVAFPGLDPLKPTQTERHLRFQEATETDPGDAQAAYAASGTVLPGDETVEFLYPDEAPLSHLAFHGVQAGPDATLGVTVRTYDETPADAPQDLPTGILPTVLLFSVDRDEHNVTGLDDVTFVVRVPAGALEGMDPEDARLLRGVDTNADGTADTWNVLTPVSIDASGDPVLFTFRLDGFSYFAIAFSTTPAAPATGGGAGPPPSAAPVVDVQGVTMPGVPGVLARYETPPRSVGADGTLRVGFPATEDLLQQVEIRFDEQASHVRLIAQRLADPGDAASPGTAGFAPLSFLRLRLEGPHGPLPPDAIGGATLTLRSGEPGPEALVVLRHDGTGWTPRPTRVDAVDAHGATLVADLPGFSLFALARDEEPPHVVFLPPLDRAQAVIGPLTPLRAAVTDNRGVHAVEMALGGTILPVTFEDGVATHTPTAPLPAGEHELVVTATDESGLEATDERTLVVAEHETDPGLTHPEGTPDGRSPGPLGVVLVVLVLAVLGALRPTRPRGSGARAVEPAEQGDDAQDTGLTGHAQPNRP